MEDNTPVQAGVGGNVPAQTQPDVKQASAAVASPAAASDVKPSPESSAGEGVKSKEPSSIREALQKGLEKLTGKAKPEEAPTADPKPEQAADPEQKKPEVKDDQEDPASDEEKAAPPDVKDHPAFKKVTSERKQARRERNKALKELEVHKQDASRYRNIQGFLKQHNVSEKDAAEALKLTALIYTNPQEAYGRLVKLAQDIGQQFGMVLPGDLQKEVEEGIISPERATELAKARGQVRSATMQAQHASTRAQAADTQSEMAYRTKLFENWASQKSRTDTALDKKLPMITSRLTQMLMEEGDPGSPEAAWQRLERAYTDVENYTRQFLPQKSVVQPSPTSTGTPRSPATPPRTYEEAKEAGLNRIMSGAGTR